MALEEFDREEMSERDKGLVRMKSITNYVMGISLFVQDWFFYFQLQKRHLLLINTIRQ